MSKPRITLGIETSCDETAAAVYDQDHGILSSVLYSQIELQKEYGGVVPELASRSQLEKITPIVNVALERASVSINDLDVIAVTYTPGLAGSLLVGVCFAKALAWSAQKNLVGVNHLEGHAFSSFLEHDVPFDHICLTASGGHTSLYLIKGLGNYDVLGRTQDDAAGEAFDKVAKLLGLQYPGGPIIEKLAQAVGFKDYFKYPRATKGSLDFSFSGLKTAVLYDLVKRDAYDLQNKKFLKEDDDQFKAQVASSLLVCIADIFQDKLAIALQHHPRAAAVTFVGGVACNKYISARLSAFCQSRGTPFYKPSPQYCTDNGAMIAFVGNYRARQGKFADWNLDIIP